MASTSTPAKNLSLRSFLPEDLETKRTFFKFPKSNFKVQKHNYFTKIVNLSLKFLGASISDR